MNGKGIQNQKPKMGGNVVDNIKKLEQQREDRRKKFEEMKQAKVDRKAMNEALGKMVDPDFDLMIDQHKKKVDKPLNHVSSSQMNLCVCVRKRPLFDKEYQAGEIDCVSASNPKIVVHECKFKVDGITKFVEDTDFKFDNVYSEQENTEDVYQYQIKTLLPNLFKNGVVTCFAYGQTGSGKTFTMNSVTKLAIRDLYDQASSGRSGISFYISFFEIYGGKVLDLLNGRKKLSVLEDKYQRIQVTGLEEKESRNAQDMLDLINYGHSVRTTHQTVANDTSSRSHAICQISIRESNGKTIGKLLLVDLAGSERAQDTQSNNRQRRIEGAEINKSLLALKECIRAIDMKSHHLPFRASKLTMVLRDSFLNDQGSSKIVMIACINPGSSSADHSLNTLRYAQRLKSNSSSDYNNPAQIGYQQVKPSQPQQQNQGPALYQPSQQQQQPLQKQVQNIENKQPASQLKPSQDDKLKEEKKRAQWGAGAAENKRNQGGKPAIDQDENPKEMKQKKKEDWNYLKSTLNHNQGEAMIDPQLLTFHEKVDRIVDEEEELMNKHLQYLKEAATLLTEEGELISNVQGVGSVEYDIDEYVNRMERIVQRNIEIYTDMQRRVLKFKKHLREEEEAHQNLFMMFNNNKGSKSCRSQVNLNNHEAFSQSKISTFLSLKTSQDYDDIREKVINQLKKSRENLTEIIERANLDKKDKLFDFDVVTFMKKYFDMSYQEAALVVKVIKGPEQSDMTTVNREDFFQFLGYSSKNSIESSNDLKSKIKNQSTHFQKSNYLNSVLSVKQSTSGLLDLKQSQQNKNLLKTNVQQLHPSSSLKIKKQFLRDQDNIEISNSSRNSIRNPAVFSPQSHGSGSKMNFDSTHDQALSFQFSNQTSIRTSVQSISNIFSQQQSPSNQSLQNNTFNQAITNSLKLFSPQNQNQNSSSKRNLDDSIRSQLSLRTKKASVQNLSIKERYQAFTKNSTQHQQQESTQNQPNIETSNSHHSINQRKSYLKEEPQTPSNRDSHQTSSSAQKAFQQIQNLRKFAYGDKQQYLTSSQINQKELNNNAKENSNNQGLRNLSSNLTKQAFLSPPPFKSNDQPQNLTSQTKDNNQLRNVQNENHTQISSSSTNLFNKKLNEDFKFKSFQQAPKHQELKSKAVKVSDMSQDQTQYLISTESSLYQNSSTTSDTHQLFFSLKKTNLQQTASEIKQYPDQETEAKLKINGLQHKQQVVGTNLFTQKFESLENSKKCGQHHKNYKSVIYQTNTKSRSNSFIRGSPKNFLQATQKLGPPGQIPQPSSLMKASIAADPSPNDHSLAPDTLSMLNPSGSLTISSGIPNVHSQHAEQQQQLNSTKERQNLVTVNPSGGGVCEKYMDQMENVKRKCQELDQQKDKRHSEVFQQDVEFQQDNEAQEEKFLNDQYEDQRQSCSINRMARFDRNIDKNNKVSIFSLWHVEDFNVNINNKKELKNHENYVLREISPQKQPQQDLQSEALQQSHRNNHSNDERECNIDHFKSISNNVVSPIQQQKIIESNQLPQHSLTSIDKSTSKIRQRMREIQEEFNSRLLQNQKHIQSEQEKYNRIKDEQQFEIKKDVIQQEQSQSEFKEIIPIKSGYATQSSKVDLEKHFTLSQDLCLQKKMTNSNSTIEFIDLKNINLLTSPQQPNTITKCSYLSKIRGYTKSQDMNEESKHEGDSSIISKTQSLIQSEHIPQLKQANSQSGNDSLSQQLDQIQDSYIAEVSVKQQEPQSKLELYKQSVISVQTQERVQEFPSKRKILNEKLNGIKARLRRQNLADKQAHLPLSKVQKSIEFAENAQQTINQAEIEDIAHNRSLAEEEKNEMTRTFAMDVNESFGTFGQKNQKVVSKVLRSSKEFQDLDYDSSDYKTQRREPDLNDPREILRSLRDGVSKAIGQSTLRPNIEENRSVDVANQTKSVASGEQQCGQYRGSGFRFFGNFKTESSEQSTFEENIQDAYNSNDGSQANNQMLSNQPFNNDAHPFSSSSLGPKPIMQNHNVFASRDSLDEQMEQRLRAKERYIMEERRKLKIIEEEFERKQRQLQELQFGEEGDVKKYFDLKRDQ